MKMTFVVKGDFVEPHDPSLNLLLTDVYKDMFISKIRLYYSNILRI